MNIINCELCTNCEKKSMIRFTLQEAVTTHSNPLRSVQSKMESKGEF